MSRKTIVLAGVLGGFVALGLGLTAFGCGATGGLGTSGASLPNCIQMAQEAYNLNSTDPCGAARLSLQAMDAGCYSYLQIIPGLSGQAPTEADARTQLNQFLASPYCTGS